MVLHITQANSIRKMNGSDDNETQRMLSGQVIWCASHFIRVCICTCIFEIDLGLRFRLLKSGSHVEMKLIYKLSPSAICKTYLAFKS